MTAKYIVKFLTVEKDYSIKEWSEFTFKYKEGRVFYAKVKNYYTQEGEIWLLKSVYPVNWGSLQVRGH